MPTLPYGDFISTKMRLRLEIQIHFGIQSGPTDTLGLNLQTYSQSPYEDYYYKTVRRLLELRVTSHTGLSIEELLNMPLHRLRLLITALIEVTSKTDLPPMPP